MASAATVDFRIDPATGLPIGAPVIPGMPGLPTYPGIAGVNELFDPNFGRAEVQTLGAENAIAGGFGMGGFGANQTTRLLDSERKANFLAGHQILEPYLQRDFQGNQNAADRQSRLNEIAAQGANALQQLQLSQSGEDRRLTQAEEAQVRRDILLGQQAMQQLTIQEAGDTSRQRETIGGTLANTLLQGELSGRTGGGGTRPGTPGNPYTAANPSGPLGFNQVDVRGTVVPTTDWTGNSYRNPVTPSGGAGTHSFGLGSTSVDALLRRYGLI